MPPPVGKGAVSVAFVRPSICPSLKITVCRYGAPENKHLPYDVIVQITAVDGVNSKVIRNCGNSYGRSLRVRVV